ncbi:alpha/beta hydrolase [Pseudoxanthomonas sacheonensis]|nr:alpha/beta hydrolase [Pseudoxanthomonas sacheonensis]
MDRRSFLAASAGMIASGMLAGCASRMAGEVAPGGAALDAAAFHGARRYVATRFGSIAYVERGSGPAALFLHGFPLNGFQWRGALDRLSPYRRCIAPDFLGMGYTQVAEGQSCTPEAQVDMLLALLDALSVSSVDVVANDSGGAVAQLLAARHRDHVRTLLLTNCDTEHDSPPPALLPVIQLAKEGRFVDEWLGRWHADRALARSSEGIGGMCYADPAQPTDEAIDTYFGPLLSTQQRTDNAHAYAVALERNALAGIGPELRRCRVPTRIVWGMGDTIFSTKSPRRLDHEFGHSRGVRLLKGSKLFWPEERPDVIAEEAQRLWNAWIPTNGRGSR